MRPELDGHLASEVACIERMRAGWPEFRARRMQRLRERERFGHAAEAATERILEDLFTVVLDWSIGELNHQVGRADLSLTRQGIKWLIVEMKRPGSLAWNATARDDALLQAWGYAEEQKVEHVAVSDGILLYAADVCDGGLRQRLACDLDRGDPPRSLWWLSVHGIYRQPPPLSVEAPPAPDPAALSGAPASEEAAADGRRLVHPKYQRPASCFAYVEDPGNTKTWRLPYLQADGSVDASRLPKAIQTIVSNYRGRGVKGIPDAAVPDVLVRLGMAARSLGKLPEQDAAAAAAYVSLVKALDQLGRLDEVTGAPDTSRIPDRPSPAGGGRAAV